MEKDILFIPQKKYYGEAWVAFFFFSKQVNFLEKNLTSKEESKRPAFWFWSKFTVLLIKIFFIKFDTFSPALKALNT